MTNGSRRRRGKLQGLVLLVKKFVAFLFSHVGLCALVIGYTMLGAVVFRAIERPHEIIVHSNVSQNREDAKHRMWNATYLHEADELSWRPPIADALHHFKGFLLSVIQKGYDATEQQWTFSGAFLYSLTVITTIGYGNIACRTVFGKAMTIIYAILGIPLMLLFLTNIGDVLAKVFKFLYRKSVRLKLYLQVWNKRRKARQLRRANSVMTAAKTLQQLQQQQPPQNTPPMLHHVSPHSSHARIARRQTTSSWRGKRGPGAANNSKLSVGASRAPLVVPSSSQTSLQLLQQHQQESRHRPSAGSGSSGGHKTPRASPAGRANHHSHQHLQLHSSQAHLQLSQESFTFGATAAPPPVSTTSVTAVAIEELALEQLRLETLAQRYELEEYSLRESTEDKLSKVTVPLWLVFLTMLGYLIAGAVLFTLWEGWQFLESFYFCYVSLATIGFGDLFPGQSLKDVGAQEKLIITSLYLLLGMALIAMCFNLAQEEVVNKMTRIAGKLGIISSPDQDDSVYETES